ncbi:MAG TPA: ergothioneine biosynthesis protein EgtB [Steroidobacteraceae bacterium]|jgi:ergothioneine biosynthesis protein EgtB|nr:ergothioneine biosynthesis protein EgtB [Steroidobacteraceae bacterium]
MKISTFFWEREVRGIVAQNHALLPVDGMQLADRISMIQDNRFRLVRAATLALSEPLSPEDYVVQSMPDASPTKWHLAHTTWFFEEFVLQHAVPGYKFHDDQFRYLFNSYYNTVGPMHSRPHRGLLSRPTVEQVLAYRARIDERMKVLLQREDLSPEILDVITLGLNHEQQHQELLLTDLKHLFSCNPLLPAYVRESATPLRSSPALSFKSFDGGLIEIGHEGDEFSFDNERPRHRTYTTAFHLANRAITNGEYLEFVRAGGYENPVHWLSDGWATVQREGWKRPIYWSASLDAEFTLTGLRGLNPHSPVCHLSYYEADAFAHWAGARLPSEAEWELAANEAPVRGNFVENRRWHPEPASSDNSLLQMFGDVWEWTQSAYAPYPGFKPAKGALGEYNGKFMVNQLVLRGGSCATPASHIRASYRNFFSPAARWQFTGLRLARDV